jgi:hypothetical protein
VRLRESCSASKSPRTTVLNKRSPRSDRSQGSPFEPAFAFSKGTTFFASPREAAFLFRCATLSGMPKLDVVAILKQEHRETKASVSRLDEAIRVLERLDGKGPSRRSGISAAGRKRIAAAQRKRWAKLRLVKNR